MTIFQSILLGIVQGLTEFIPISSSAHLALLPYFLGWRLQPDLAFVFDVLVQFATLGAVIVYYAKDLWQLALSFINVLKKRRIEENSDFILLMALIVGTLPIVVFGLPLKKYVVAAFNSPLFVGAALLITALLLFLADSFTKTRPTHSTVTIHNALVIGLFQVVAAFPGISRSGAAISGGLFQKLDRSSATRFAFLLSIPALTGAGLVSLLDLFKSPQLLRAIPIILPGFVIAFIVGLFSIHWLVKYVQNHSLKLFSAYCLIIGLFTLGFLYFH